METEELRTSLVYEVRVFVKDPSDQLHLGSPATVYLPTVGESAGAECGGDCASAAMSSRAALVAPAIIGNKIHKKFPRDKGEAIKALDNVSFEVRRGALTALVGPDGAGKTTLMRLAAGLMTADAGALSVLGIDVAANPQQVQDRIGYMPQRFGLYADLSVQENLDLYADLHGIGPAERRELYPELMEMTALGPFVDRLAGRLSGGMKQKLGLACTLIRSPELLLLDEPTVGVDPLSRRELWEIILQLVNQQGLTVLLSTSYLDEAERCSHVVVLHEGMVLAQGHPDEVSELARGRVFLGRAVSRPNTTRDAGAPVGRSLCDRCGPRRRPRAARDGQRIQRFQARRCFNDVDTRTVRGWLHAPSATAYAGSAGRRNDTGTRA